MIKNHQLCSWWMVFLGNHSLFQFYSYFLKFLVISIFYHFCFYYFHIMVLLYVFYLNKIFTLCFLLKQNLHSIFSYYGFALGFFLLLYYLRLLYVNMILLRVNQMVEIKMWFHLIKNNLHVCDSTSNFEHVCFHFQGIKLWEIKLRKYYIWILDV